MSTGIQACDAPKAENVSRKETMDNILIVGNDKAIMDTIKEIVCDFNKNIECLFANHAQEAITIIKDKSIDLIITEMNISDMDNFEFLYYVNQNFPGIPSIVLDDNTDYRDSDRLKSLNVIKVLPKPIDRNEINRLFNELFKKDVTEGAVSGISLSGIIQIVEMEEKNCIIDVEDKKSNAKGKIYIKDGSPHAALYGKNTGEEAFYKMMFLSTVTLRLKKPPNKHIKKNIFKSCMSLLLEGSRRVDEMDNKSSQIEEDSPANVSEQEQNADDVLPENDFVDSPPASEGAKEIDSSKSSNHIQGEEPMAMQEVKDALENFKGIDGLEAVAVVTPDGELAAQFNPGNIKLAEMAAMANDVLLKSQKSSESMGLGRGSMVHIEAPQGEILCRCLNEATDFAMTSSGRAHIHLVVVLDKEGGLGMAKMKSENVIQELAPMFR